MIIHAGDEANSRTEMENVLESWKFFDWYASLPGEKYFVPGNHSIAFERGMVPPFVRQGINILSHTGDFRDDGLKLFGSPYTPAWGNSWAYMIKRHKLSDVWASLPEELDILITHGPPKGVLDITRDRDTNALIQVGCASLRKRVAQIKPKIHIFGHIHDEKGVSNAGVFERDGTKFVNCSVCDNRGNLINNGVVIDV
jgi:Icc-related predicted phosphoesterase